MATLREERRAANVTGMLGVGVIYLHSVGASCSYLHSTSSPPHPSAAWLGFPSRKGFSFIQVNKAVSSSSLYYLQMVAIGVGRKQFHQKYEKCWREFKFTFWMWNLNSLLASVALLALANSKCKLLEAVIFQNTIPVACELQNTIRCKHPYTSARKYYMMIFAFDMMTTIKYCGMIHFWE